SQRPLQEARTCYRHLAGTARFFNVGGDRMVRARAAQVQHAATACRFGAGRERTGVDAGDVL
ncbi:hypothetical protein, partial [Oleiagrimonas sp. MCCC 1A03011]|uniref:hypothetical protein n=1 Tax=Oleiagrimonas sp. MCCC 1A03011 TaxID=1926883 RepID=UPI0019805BE0